MPDVVWRGVLMFPAEEINATSVELLFTDTGLGRTFADIAASSQNAETVKRNITNARKAYDTVQRLRLRLNLIETQERDLDERLLDLKTSLAALGEVF